MTNRSKQSHIDEMIQMLTDRGCTPISVTMKCVNMVYICRCGKEKSQKFSDFKRNKKCRKCKSLGIIDNDDDLDPKQIDPETGEIWLRTEGGWISSFGRAKRRFNDDDTLTLYENRRYLFNGKKPYARRLVAIAFQIEGYELLTKPDGTSDQNWRVSMRDPAMTTPQPGYLENLYVRTNEDVGRQNGSKSRKVNKWKSYKPSDFAHLERRVVPDVSENHIVYENGEIWNGKWFLQFSQPNNDKYLSATNLNGTRFSCKVHRLVCYAFHPIEGYECLDDYKHLQVNHIDGNTLNNHKDNLEWVTQSANMSHAYRTGLNKKVRCVLQYEKGSDNFIAEYPSIAEASRQTGESEHNIREFARQKAPCRKRIYDWKFANPEESEEYSRKYRSYK